MINSHLRQNPRYRIKSDADVTVTIDTGDGIQDSIRAELVDISLGGAKFKTDVGIRAQRIVSVRIEGSDPQQIIEVAGSVCWLTPVTADAWYVGCAFKPPIPEEALHRFAETGVLERRSHERKPLSLPASAKWELHSDVTPVSITDYSPLGGFCLLAPSSGQAGSRVELQVNRDGREVSVRGKIQWTSTYEECFLVGCEFLNGSDAIRFAEIVDDEQTGARPIRFSWHGLRSRSPIRVVARLAPLAKRRTVRRRFTQAGHAGLAMLLLSVVLPSETSSPWNAGHATADVSMKVPVLVKSPLAKPRESATTPLPAAIALETTSIQLDSTPAAQRSRGVRPQVFARESGTGTLPVDVDRQPLDVETHGDATRNGVGDVNLASESLSASESAPRDGEVLSVATEAAVDSEESHPELAKSSGFVSGTIREIIRYRVFQRKAAHALSASASPPEDDRAGPSDAVADHVTHTESQVAPPPDETLSPARESIVPVAPTPDLDVMVSFDDVAEPDSQPSRAETTHDTPEIVERALPDQPSVADALLPPHEPEPPAVKKPNPEKAEAALRQGSALYRDRQYEQAAAALQSASRADPSDPLTWYLLAMAQFQLEQNEQALASVQQAAALERTQPLRDWGQLMESYQGPARSWLERARRQARTARFSR